MSKTLYLLAILVITISCKTTLKNSKQKNDNTVASVEAKPSFISEVDTIVDPNAPKRITRNVKLDSDGHILIAAYDDIITYNGNSFSKLAKPKNLESWYAFDVLEDRNKNIWIASDQLGAFRIDSKTDSVTNYTTKDGLGHMRNMCVYEDKAGNIWIGGQGGLNQFNGKKFTTYTTEDGLPHNDINTIFEDHNGNIWFGTRGHAGIYKDKVFSEIHNNEGQPFFNVWSIFEDQANNILLVDSSGLWQYSHDTFEFKKEKVWKIYEDSKGNYWYTGMISGGGSTLKHINGKTFDTEEIEVTEVFKSERMFFGVIEDNQNNIWIGGGAGIWRYNGKTVKYYTGIEN